MGWNPDAGKSYFIKSKLNGLVLDVANGSNEPGTPIIQWPCHGGVNQQFVFDPADDGSYFIRNVKSGLVLDIYGGSIDDGAQIIQYTKHGGDNQRFFVDDANGGAVSLRSKKSGRVIDVPASTTKEGTELIQWGAHGGDNQRFGLRSDIPTTLRLVSITCHQPSSDIDTGANTIVSASATIAGAGIGLAGVTGGTSIAVAGAVVGLVGLGSLIAGWIDFGRTPDDLYIKVDGNKVWPGGKSYSLPQGETITLNMDFPGWTSSRTIQLWDYDTVSNDDALTPALQINPMTVLWDAEFIVMAGSSEEDSLYSLTFALR